METQKPQTNHDDILNRLQYMESRIKNQSKNNLSYQSIFNEPINPMILIKRFLYKFKIPQIMKFKGNEYPREHLRQFKYSCYIIRNDDVIMLRKFLIILMGQALDWCNNFP